MALSIPPWLRKQVGCRRRDWRVGAAGLVLAVGGLLTYPVSPVGAAEPVRRDSSAVGTWATAPVSAAPTEDNRINDQTLRQIVHITIGGDRLRVKLSNRYGTASLLVQAAHVALRAGDEHIVPGSGGQLTFSGSTSFVIPEFGELYSDWLDFRVPDLVDLAIDLYLPADTMASSSPLTLHYACPTNQLLSYVASGNQIGVESFSAVATRTTWYFLTGVDVTAQRALGGAVVAVGDSITDGTASNLDVDERWPDFLARRLDSDNSILPMGVLNLGVDGNTMLFGGTGDSALARFDPDALEASGATDVIVLEGTNDISSGTTAERVIEGHRQLIARAHARGLRIYGATLTPFANAPASTEGQRQTLNAWIRDSGDYDAVIDFDAAIRDPANPQAILPIYDSGDTLHPNSAGYEAMANAIDLDLFKPGRPANHLTDSDLDAVATWGAPLVSANPATTIQIRNQTLRQITHISIGGDQVRVKLSNRWGTTPLVVEAAQVALRSADQNIVPKSSRPLTFSENPSFTIPAGAEVLSDWVEFEAPDLTDLAIDIYLPGDTRELPLSPLSVRLNALQTTYLSEPGNHVGSLMFPLAATRPTVLAWGFLAEVDVTATQRTGTIVALGDSITEGLRSTANTNRRWPDVLARRLMALPTIQHRGVVNLGISGNRVGAGRGPRTPAPWRASIATCRVKTGATHIIVLLGINDIIGGATAEDVIAGLKQVITRAHTAGMTIHGGHTDAIRQRLRLHRRAPGGRERMDSGQWRIRRCHRLRHRHP